MNLSQAQRLMVAAKDDAVLAAWSAVVLEYRSPAQCDISPYEAWDAYQGFLMHGLITSAEYDRTDLKACFFSGQRPSTGAIQEVITNLKFLCPDHDKRTEPQMPKLGNPFSNKEAIATRERGALSEAPVVPGIAGQRSSAPLQPFSNNREAIPGPRQPAMPAITPNTLADRGAPRLRLDNPHRKVLDQDIQPIIFCGKCEMEVELSLDGGDNLGPDDHPGGNVSVIDRIFYGKCHGCQTVFHCSAGRRIPQDSF